MNKLHRLTIALMATACLCPVAEAQKVVILATNDTHSQIDPASDGLGGVLRRRAAIDQVRRDNKNVLVLDAGDDVQGTLYFSLYKGAVEYACLDSIGFDMTTMGNHEFDNGMASLAKNYAKMRTPKVSTNYDASATPLAGLLQPYIIKAVGDKRVGIFAVNVNPKGLIADNNWTGLVCHNAFDVADATAKYLKEVQKVDFVTMVSHLGYDNPDPSEPCDSVLLTRSHYIDLVVSAHTHTMIKPGSPMNKVRNADGRMITIGQNGKSGKYIGRYDVDLATGNVDYSQIKLDSSLDAAAAQYTAMKAWLAQFSLGVDSLMNTPVATSARAMRGDSPAFQNWISDATMEILRDLSGQKIDFAIMNKGGIRQDMPKGDVSEGLINSIFPFNNRFMVIDVTGQQLLDALKVMTRRGGDAISKELKVVYKGNSIVSAKVNGKNVTPKATYTMATIDYLANGGDYMTSLKSAKRLWVDDKPYSVHVLNYVKGLTAKGKKIDATDEVRMMQK